MIIPKKGQVIFCKSCNKNLLRFVRDIVAGERTQSDQVEGIEEQKADDSMQCIHCGSRYNLIDIRDES